ncbi:hypothetical protein GCM10010289_85530 [Streptomyces violascens]|nr:hypothetical protein GCM10010289_85530 [Streptomyces violascens]
MWEMASKIRTGRGPENMVTMRNLAINTRGNTDSATSPRPPPCHLRAPFNRPLALLNIP